MNRFKIIGLLLLSLSFFTCERDDICPEDKPTTPRLIIDLFDATDQTVPKNVFDIVVVGIGNDFILEGYEFQDVGQFILPLKTDADETSYALIKDASIDDNGTPDDTADDFITGNQDIITVSYTREDQYVSRACGFKTVFRNVLISVTPDTNNWVNFVLPINDNQSVEDETTTHYNLFH